MGVPSWAPRPRIGVGQSGPASLLHHPLYAASYTLRIPYAVPHLSHMATFEKRGNSVQARVCVKRVRQSATFPDMGRAKAWAAKVETELRAQARGEIIPRSVRQALERYGEHVSPLHRGCRWEQVRLHKFNRTIPFAARKMQDVTRADVVTWRDGLLETLATSSARREFGLLRAVFAEAIEWQWLHRSPFEGVKPPSEGKARSRRVSDAEIAAVCRSLAYEPGIRPETASQYIGAAIVLAVETAMRQGEILTLDQESRRGPKILHLDKTKNGDERDVPLSLRAREIVATLPTDGHLFPIAAGTFDTLFRRARGKADWHFHDLRREATTRLSAKLDVMMLARVTGHRDLKVLLKTYYAPDVSSLADRLD